MNFPRMGQVKRIHFLGIGGVGMAGIAEVLIDEGYQVSGSDLNENLSIKRLKKLGATIMIGHEASHVEGADVIVRSSAVGHDNVEVIAANEQRIPIVPRAGMLAELMRFRFSVAIAGTHGKTTTTSLLSSILADAGIDPTYIIGGKLNSTQSNARLGKSPYLIAEADESDKSFLLLNPMMAVVTNIDADHLLNYQGKFSHVKEAFIDFLHRLPFYGLAILCVDDPVIKEILPQVSRPAITYGFGEDADVCITEYSQQGSQCHFTVNGERFMLNLPGRHNALNAVAALIVAKQLKVELASIQSAFAKFSGVGRRFQDHGSILLGGKTCQLIDDYAHHPNEIQATLEAARAAWPNRRIVGVFQPHRYSRTQEQFDEYCRVLVKFDALLLLPVYSAGEALIESANSNALAMSIRQRKQVDPIVVADEELHGTLANIVSPGDLVLTMGAGSIGQMVASLLATINAEDSQAS